jgi:ABC-type multidrug transport system permease subunit
MHIQADQVEAVSTNVLAAVADSMTVEETETWTVEDAEETAVECAIMLILGLMSKSLFYLSNQMKMRLIILVQFNFYLYYK